MSETLSGGGLCGAIRYRYEGTPGTAFNCHYSICFRSAGAPYLAWMTLNSAGFTLKTGAPEYRHSNQNGRLGSAPTAACSCSSCSIAIPIASTAPSAATAGRLQRRPYADLFAQDRLGWVARDDARRRFDAMPPGWPW